MQIELPSIMPLDCMVSQNFYSKLILKCVWPLCAYIALVALSKVFRKLGKDGKADSCIDFTFFLMASRAMSTLWPCALSSSAVACPS